MWGGREGRRICGFFQPWHVSDVAGSRTVCEPRCRGLYYFAEGLYLLEPRRFGVGARRYKVVGLNSVDEQQATILSEHSDWIRASFQCFCFARLNFCYYPPVLFQDGSRLRLVQRSQICSSPTTYRSLRRNYYSYATSSLKN